MRSLRVRRLEPFTGFFDGYEVTGEATRLEEFKVWGIGRDAQ